MVLSSGQKIYLTLSAILIIIVCLVCFLVYPLVKKVRTTSISFQEKNRMLSLLRKKDKDYLAELEEEYKEHEPNIILSEKAFLDSDKTIDFVFALERIALQTGNEHEIRETTLSEVEKEILPFQISLWGSFPDLVKFLVNLENMTHFVDVDSIQIRRLAEGSRTGKRIGVSVGDVESTIKIKVYTK